MKSAIFIDGANVYGTVRALGYEIDYARLIPAFNADGSLLRAFYYTATLTVDGHNTLRPLLDWLDYNHYTVVTKESKTFVDKLTGLTKVKGNMDMEIAVDCMRMADHVDEIILFSGDGDFTYLVRALQQKGCRVTIVSSLCTGVSHSPMIADELRRAADIFLDLNDPRLKVKLEKRHANASVG
jgi:uncharacterized LabA/DUF88 family protein